MADRSLTVRLRAEVDQYRRDMALAAAATSSVGQAAADAGKQRSAMQQLGDAGKGVGKTLLAVSGAAVAGMAALAVGTFKTGIAYNTLEQTSRAALTTLLGSAAKASEQMDLLREFGRSSPFPRQVWIEAQQQLLAFGLAAERIIPTLSAIQDAVAAAGGSSVDIQEVVRVLAQVQSTGKATAETLNQLGVRGIDAATLIGDAMGRTAADIREDISSGALDAATFLTVLTDAMTVRFGGAAENVKNTWFGATDRIKGALRDIGSVMAEPFVDPAGGGAAVQWANDIADALRALEAQIRSALPALQAFAGPGFERVSDLLQALAGHIRDLDIDAGGLIERLSAGGPALAGFGAAAAAAGSASALTAVGMGSLATAINPLAAGILAVAVTSPEMRQALVELLAALAPLVPVLLDTATALATGLSAGVATLAEVLLLVIPLVDAIVQVFTALPEPIQTAAVAVGAFALALRFAGPVGVAIAALAALGSIIEAFGPKTIGASIAVSDLGEDLTRLSERGRVTGELWRLFGEDADFFRQKLGEAALDAGLGADALDQLTDASGRLRVSADGDLSDAASRFAALDEGLAELIETGTSSEDLLAALAEQYGLTAEQVEVLLQVLPLTTAEMEREAEVTADAAAEQGGFAAQIDEATEALREQAEELRAQTDPIFALFKALDEVKTAQSAYNDAVGEFGAESTEAEAAARALLEAAVGMQGAAGDASGAFDGKLTPAMRSALVAAGFTEDQIAAVEEELRDAKDALDDYTGRYEAEVKLQGAGEAKRLAEQLQRSLANIDRFVTITFETRGAAPAGALRVPGQQHGGPVVGAPGPDRVLRALTSGEHVWTVQEVQAAGGHAGVEALRSMVLGQSSRFATSAPIGSAGVSAGGSAAAASLPGHFTASAVIDLGEGIRRRVDIEFERHDGELMRAIEQGVGAAL